MKCKYCGKCVKDMPNHLKASINCRDEHAHTLLVQITKKDGEYNPLHSAGTCGKCGKEMVFNVPRLGVDGGYVHRDTGQLLCEDTGRI